MNEELQVRNAACQALALGLDRKAVFLDVGAMGGPQTPHFRYLCASNSIVYVGIEPQEAECENLRKMFPDGLFVSNAVGDISGDVPLYFTRSPACTSVLEPNFDILNNYPINTCFEVLGHSSVNVTRIETMVKTGVIPMPDYIKCDAQGYDYQVLEGCGDVLETVLGIEVECQFRQIYKDQKTFYDIKQLLEAHGFILRDMKHQGAFEYEVVEINAFFSKRPHLIGDQLQRLKLWEFASCISSPLSFAQLKLSNGDNSIFRKVTKQMERTVLFQ